MPGTVSESYSTYGLRLNANLPIPGLISSTSGAKTDIEVSLGTNPPWLNETLSTARLWYTRDRTDKRGVPTLSVWELADGKYFRFLYADGTQFVIDQRGTEVWATWPDSLTVEDTAVYLLGPILGFVLLLRGLLSLHASALVTDEQVIALIGPAGAGKSTAAAAFANRGYGIIAEDVVTLEDRGTSFLIRPAYPCIRLWPSSVEALFGVQADLPKLTPTWEKRYLDLNQDQYLFERESRPLAAIYMLGERSDKFDAPFVREVSHAEALLSLIGNTYAVYLMDKPMRSRQFEFLSRVVANVPFRHVTPHSDPALISRLCTTIIEDFEKMKSLDRSTSTKSVLHV